MIRTTPSPPIKQTVKEVKMKEPKESDWKLFKSRLDEQREKYLTFRNSEIIKQLSNPDNTATDNYWNALKKMKEEKKILDRCLSGYKRSNMLQHIVAMCYCGMMTDEDLLDFSEELQERVRELLSFE